MGKDAAGAELRGTGKQPFHGVKGAKLTFTMPERGDRKVAFVESAIDAISLYELDFNGLIVSTVGSAAARTREMADAYRARGIAVVAAFDNDRAGEQMATNIGFPRERLRPEGKDWNDDLRAARAKPVGRLTQLLEPQERQPQAKRERSRSGPSMGL